MKRIVISSGHGLLIRGARGIIDEVDEARRVTDRVSDILRGAGIQVNTFHENNARTQAENVGAIVRHHNSQVRDLDVSIHFNSTATGAIEERGIGIETLYRIGNAITRQLARDVSREISNVSRLILRNNGNTIQGAWARNNLGFLNNTNQNAILIEVCFVNSRTDVRLYQQHFEEICRAIAETISDQAISPPKALSPEDFREITAWPTVNIKMAPNQITVPAELISGRWRWAVSLHDGTVAEINLRDTLEALGFTSLEWDRASNTIIAGV